MKQRLIEMAKEKTVDDALAALDARAIVIANANKEHLKFRLDMQRKVFEKVYGLSIFSETSDGWLALAGEVELTLNALSPFETHARQYFAEQRQDYLNAAVLRDELDKSGITP